MSVGFGVCGTGFNSRLSHSLILPYSSSPSCLVCKKNNHTDLVRVKENISAHTRANVYIHTHAYTPVYLYTPKHMSASTCIHLAQNR